MTYGDRCRRKEWELVVEFNNRDNDNHNNDDDNNRNNDNNNDNDNNRNNNYDDDNNNSNSNSNSSNRSRDKKQHRFILRINSGDLNRIDPVIDIVSRPANTQKAQKTRIRSERYKQNKTEAEIPKGAPIWTLSREALEHLNWVNRDIPIYDPDEDNDNNEEEEDNDNNEEVGTSSRKRKRKGKGKEKK
ncbi:hypothetical protein Glove_311g48 [Diversispora epigaea]|uniref:Uncharacterized protein n=1 Tax=Diversispora epigaea TaxID=1348612 RepID=A0A397HRW7_9GLOM|nr:hypothetical protein Glove_311g48 [Diversispora epigaea]